jgi:hypothetical protein
MGPNAGISHKNMWAAWALLQRQYHTMMVSFSESPESGLIFMMFVCHPLHLMAVKCRHHSL